MVWIRSLEDNYVNADAIISITFDQKVNAFVAVVGHKDIRLQHKIYQHQGLDHLLQGHTSRSEAELLEEMIGHIEKARRTGEPLVLDFTKLL